MFSPHQSVRVDLLRHSGRPLDGASKHEDVIQALNRGAHLGDLVHHRLTELDTYIHHSGYRQSYKGISVSMKARRVLPEMVTLHFVLNDID